MGSALGPTFANFYMCELENKIFDVYPNSKPLFYIWYVDDICLIVDQFHCLKQLSELLERHSVLKFTHEIEINKKIAFLDVLIDRNDSNYNIIILLYSLSQPIAENVCRMKAYVPIDINQV